MRGTFLRRGAVGLLICVAASTSHAFDRSAVLKSITAARKAPPIVQPSVVLPSGAMSAPPPPESPVAEQTRRLASEQQAWLDLLSTCEGRFGDMRRRLERQVSRAEKIALTGGLVGVIGAVATCPHCAALAAGIAGLANPLQQTFKANGDTPQDSLVNLDRLSTTINAELDIYRQLPPAVPGDAAFETNLRNRLDQLLVTTASCSFYAAKVSAEAPPAPQP